MNLVGKIFIVLIFLMAVVFGAFGVTVHATHKNWMKEVVDPNNGLKVQLDNARKLNDELASRKKTLEEERDLEKKRHQDALTKLETENQGLLKENKANNEALASKEKEIRDMTAALDAVHQTLKALRGECDSMRVAIKEAQADRDKNFKMVVDLTEQVHNAVNERIRLEKQNADLVGEHAKALECLAYFGKNYKADYKSAKPPAGTRGLVTAAPRPDVVEISIGSDDGIRKGHKLEVVRVGAVKSYVGRIEVMETTPDRAVCRPDKNLQRSQIQKGDRVYGDLSEAN